MTTWGSQRRLMAVCLQFLLLGGWAVAQPPPSLPDGDRAAADEAHIRRIYVPTAELDALLRGDRQGMLLPMAEFEELYRAAHKADEEALRHPEGAIVTAADYTGDIVDDQLRLTVDVRFRQFQDGWQMIRLPVGGLSLRSATLDAEPAALSRDGNQRNTLIIFSDAGGEHRLRLELAAPLQSVGSDWLAEFATLGAPSGALTIDILEGKSLRVDGLTIDAEAGQPYRVPLGGRQRVSLRITDRDLRNVADALVFAKTAYGLEVAPGEVTWSTQTSVQAFGQSLSQLSFTVPKTLEVAVVDSTGLEEWELGETDGGRRTLITLRYRQPFAGERMVNIRGVLVPDGDEWSVPNLELQNAHSHAGVIVVRHGPDVRLQADHGDEVRPVAESDDPRSLTFRTMVPSFDLELRTLGKDRLVQIAATNLLDISDDGLDLQAVMDIETFFLPLFDVRIMLPAEFEMTAADVAGSAVEWSIGNGAAGVIEVRLPLDPPLLSGDTRRITLSAHADPEDWPVENDSVLLPFPKVGLPQADMVEARYGIMADADLDVRPLELTGLDPARPADLDGLRQAAAAMGKELRLGFSYQDTVFSGQIEVTRKPTRLAVSTLALSRLDPQTVQTDIRAFVTVEGGGTEGLLIELPERAGTDLRFTIAPISEAEAPNQPAGTFPSAGGPVAIVEQTSGPPLDGRRTWALRFDRRMHGGHVIGVSLLEPRSENEPVTLPVALLTGADRQNGWVAVEAREEQRLSVTATGADGQPLQTVDPIDLPGMGADVTDRRRIVAGVRYVRPGYNVTVEGEAFDAVPVPTALADRVSAVSVLSESGLVEQQLDVSFRAVGMQSLRFGLPDGADLWAVLIDEQPVQIREAAGGFQVPLPAVEDPAAGRSLRIVYRSYFTDAGVTGRLRQTPPVITAISGAGAEEPLEILRQDWTLHYPRDVVLLSSNGMFSPSGELPSDSWLRNASESITLPTLQEAGWRIGISAGIVLAMWVMVLISRRIGNWSIPVLLIGVPAFVLVVGFCLFYNFATLEHASSEYFTATTEPAFELEVLDVEEFGFFSGEAAGEGQAGFGGGQPPANGAGTSSQRESDFATDDAPIPEALAVPPTGAEMAFDAPDAAEPQMQMPQKDLAGNRDGTNRFSDDLSAQLGGDSLQRGVQQGMILSDGTTSMFGVMPKARGALLSLSLDLEAPEGSRTQSFDTLASAGPRNVPGLDVTYATRSFREVVALVLAAGLALLMWWLREASVKTRLAIVLITIVVPVAVAPIAPPILKIVIEGVLLGGIVGAGLWLAKWIVAVMARVCERWCPPQWVKPSAGTTSLLLIVAGSLFASAPAVAEDTAAAPQHTAKADLPTVIIPYDEDGPFAADRVYLPQELFLKLWLKANPDERPKPKAPVDGLVAEAFYAVSIDVPEPDAVPDGSSPVRVRGRFVLFGFEDTPGWVRLPLGQVAIDSATFDDAPAVLRPGDKGRPHVLLSEHGLHLLDVEFEVPSELSAASGEMTLPLFPVPSGSLTLTLPADDDEPAIRVSRNGTPTLYSVTTEHADGRSRVEVPVDQGGPLLVTWQPKATRGGDDNIVHATSTAAVDIDDDGVQITADFHFQVRQGVLSDVPFRFPETVRLKRITGPDVGGWQIDGDGDDRTLRIFLRRNVNDHTTITADLFLPQDDRGDDFDVRFPPFAPLNVTRESGEVAVLAGEHLDVQPTTATDLRQLNRDAVSLPGGLNERDSSVQLAYRFVSRPWELELSVRPRPPEARAVSEHGVYLAHRRVLYSSRIFADLAGAPRQTMTIALTDDFLLTSVVGSGIEDWFIKNAELTIDFGQPRLGNVEIVLEGHIPRDPADDSAVIITPLPLELDRQQSALAVWIDPIYAATLDNFETWRVMDRAELPADLKALQESAPQFAFRSGEVEPEVVNVDLIRQEPQITADAVTLIAVSDVSVDYGLTLRWTIERAATDLLAFTVPAWLEDKLEFSGPNIRETTQEITEDGLVRWTIQLTDAVSGPYLLSAVATLPPPDDDRIAAPSLQFVQPPFTPGGTYSPLEAQQGIAVLVNLSRGRLSASRDIGGLTVSREQLPLVIRDDLLAQAMAIVRVPVESDLIWNAERLAEQQTQAAQVTAAELTSVIAIDGTVRTLTQYRVRNRGQQFLAVRLPEDSQILSVIVKDEPSRCLAATVDGNPVSLIPLPQTSAADLSFLVQIVLQDRLSDMSRLDRASFGTDMTIPVPAIVSPSKSHEYGVPVVHTSWTVYLPEGIDGSAIDDADRTNVSYQPPAAAQAIAELQLYREMADLNRLVEGKDTSTSQRLHAISNLKQLQIALGHDVPNSGRQSGSFEYFTGEDRELAQQKEQILAEAALNASKSEAEIRGEAAQFQDADAATSNSIGRGFIVGNNAFIAADNFDSGVVISGDKSKLSRFKTRTQGEEKSDKARSESIAGKAADSRSKLRGRLQSQVPLSKPAAESRTPASDEAARPDVRRQFPDSPGPTLNIVGRDDPGNGVVVGMVDGGEVAEFATTMSLVVPTDWQEAGGLSLPIDLPSTGNAMTFTKLGGDPRLALRIQPREAGTMAVRWLWAMVVFVAGAWLLHQAAHRATIHSSRNGLCVMLIAIGLVVLLCLPVPFNIIGGAMLIGGSLLLLLAKSPVTSKSPSRSA